MEDIHGTKKETDIYDTPAFLYRALGVGSAWLDGTGA
jgi:hypothetical protein